MASAEGENIRGRRVIVTGAASGIGRAAAVLLADQGAAVGLLDVDAAGLEAVEDEIANAGGEVLALTTDVTNETEVAAAVDAVVKQWGGLDVAVAAAAVALPGDNTPAHELEIDVWRHTLDVNLSGSFLTCKHAIRAMLPGKSGVVIVIGSPTAFGVFHSGHPVGGTAYSSSKGGVHSLMRRLACDYGPSGIRVNAVVPGFTDTPLVAEIMDDPEARQLVLHGVPLGRPAQSAEVVSLIAFLASDKASYASGALMNVDGGLSPL